MYVCVCVIVVVVAVVVKGFLAHIWVSSNELDNLWFFSSGYVFKYFI